MTGAVERLAAEFVRFLETGVTGEDLFTEDVFLDLTLPTWWLQARGTGELVRVRTTGHPVAGKVIHTRLDPTPTGFVLEFSERWDAGGQAWYCRELMRADIRDGRISEVAVYCTGDWDEARQREHEASVPLLRP